MLKGIADFAVFGQCRVHEGCGCMVSTCCLECPLAVCRHDAPRGFALWAHGGPERQERRQATAQLRRDGLQGLQIAQRLGVGERTVRRDLASIRGGYGSSPKGA